MKLIVGLGNPGSQYDNTPHNVGFAVLDMLAKQFKVEFRKKKNAMYAETIVNNEKIMLVKPQTYMNNSGDCVFDFFAMNQLSLKDVLVILDDIELTEGLVRTRLTGSGGTHNGLKNVILRLGSNDFARIRIGVGEPREGQDLADYVLGKMDKQKLAFVQVGMEKAMKFAIDFVQGKPVVTTA